MVLTTLKSAMNAKLFQHWFWPSPNSQQSDLKLTSGVEGNRNHLDEPVFMAGTKPLPNEFGYHHGMESGVLI